MPSWTIYRCGNCKRHISTESEGFFSEIDIPYIECPKCGMVNIRASSRNEWDLAGPLRRLGCYLGVVLFGTFMGVGAGVLVHELSKRWLGIALPGSDGEWAALGWVAGVVTCGQILRGTIAASRTRLRDPSYVLKLKQLGLVQ